MSGSTLKVQIWADGADYVLDVFHPGAIQWERTVRGSLSVVLDAARVVLDELEARVVELEAGR